MPDLLNIGTSALVAFQRALTTVSHNISNAHTDGYSRQRNELGTRVPEPSGAGFFGTGVQTETVRRSYDQFLTQQLRYQSSAFNRLDTYYEYSSQIDNLVADPDAGLTPTMEEFFGAVQDLANDPTSIGARNNLIAAAGTLTSRFDSMYERFSDMQTRVNQQIDSVVAEINDMADSIAKLNREIVSAQGAAGGQPPNDLLDKRDLILKQLSERVSISTIEQNDGMVNVFIGTGQGIVVGPTVTKLTSVPDPAMPDQRREISIGGTTSGPFVSRLMTGGTLGGLLDFQNEVLDNAERTLGNIAVALAFTFNDQHHLGLDLNNEIGGDFFDPSVYTGIRGTGNQTNTGNLSVTMDVTSAAALTGEGYVLKFADATNFQLTKSDGTVVGSGTFNSGTGAFTFGAPVPNIGFTINGAIGTNPAANDSFVLRPTGVGARDIEVQLTDPNKIAAARPIRASISTANTGTGKVSDLSITRNPGAPFTDPTALQIGGNVTLTYDQTTDQYAIAVPAGYTAVPATISYDPAVDDGRLQTITLQNPGGELIDLNFKLGGSPRTGDLITFAPNTSGFGDNGNALALGLLQTRETMLGGTSDYQTVYAGLVATVGTQTHSAEMNKDVAQTLFNQALENRDSVSGVNLDEEAANLLKYQQAYMASTKMITVADTLFKSLIDSV